MKPHTVNHHRMALVRSDQPCPVEPAGALIFLYREVLALKLPRLDKVVAAIAQRWLHVVLPPVEVTALRAALSGTMGSAEGYAARRRGRAYRHRQQGRGHGVLRLRDCARPRPPADHLRSAHLRAPGGMNEAAPERYWSLNRGPDTLARHADRKGWR